MPFRRRPAARPARPLALILAPALVLALVMVAPPAPAQGLFDQLQDLGKKIQQVVPKNERPADTATTAAPRDSGGGSSGSSGGISAERRAAMVLQRGLNTLGYDAGPVDGLPGAQTRAAIGRFQAARGFDATGALTPAQRRVFDTDVARVSGDRAAVETAEVAEMQAYLAALGYNVGTPDGAYGPRTAAALDAFRRDSGLPGGAGPTATDVASLYARVHGVAPAARPAGSVLLAAPAPGTGSGSGAGAALGTGAGMLVTPGGGQTGQPAPGVAGGAAAAVQTGPSFDCALALSDAERAICADPRLGTLDRQLADAWRAAAARGTPTEQQRAWLAERNACGTDPDCLAAAMQARLGVLTGTAPGTTGAATGTMTAAGAAGSPAAPAAPPVSEADRVHLVGNQTARLPAGLERRILMAQIAADPAMLDNPSTLEREYLAQEVARTGQPRNVVYQEFRSLNLIAQDDALRATRARLAAEVQTATPITPDRPIPVALYVPASAADYDDTQGLVLQPSGQNVGARIEALSFTVPMAAVPGIAHVPMDRAAASALLDRITAENQQRRMLMRVAFGRITGFDPDYPGRARFELDEVDLAFVPQFNRNTPAAWTPRRPDDAAIHTWRPAPDAPAGPAAPAAAGVHVFGNEVPILPDGFARRLTLAALREAPALLENLGSVRPFFIADRAAETGESENAVSQQFYALNTLEQEDILRAKRTALVAEAEDVAGFDAAPVPVAIYVPGEFPGEFDPSKGLVVRGNVTAQMSLGQRAPGLNPMPIAFAGLPDLGYMAVTRDAAKDLLDRAHAEAGQGRQLYRVVWGRIDGITNVDGYGRVQVGVTVDRVTAHFMSRYRSHDGTPFMPASPEAALFTWEPAPLIDGPAAAAPAATRLALVQNQIVTMPDGFERRMLLLSARVAPAVLDNSGVLQRQYIADRMAETGESERQVSEQFYALNALEQEDILRAKRTALLEEAKGVTGFDADPVPIAVHVPAEITERFDPSTGLEISTRTEGVLLNQRIAYAGLPDLSHMAVTRDDAKAVLDRARTERTEGRQFHQVIHGQITGIALSERTGMPQVTVDVARVTGHFLPRYRADTPFPSVDPEAALFTWEPAPVIDPAEAVDPASPLEARLAAIDPVRTERLLAEAIALQGGDDALYAAAADLFHEVQRANEFDRPAARAAAIETLKSAGDAPIWIEGSTRLGEYDLDAESFAVMGADYLRWRVGGVGTDARIGFGLVGPDPFADLPVAPEVARPIVEAGDRRDVRFLMRVAPVQVTATGSPTRPQYGLTLRPEEVIFYRDGARDPQTGQNARDPLGARDFAAENDALDARLARRFAAEEFAGLADRVPDLAPHVLDLIAVRAAGAAPRDAAALNGMMLAAWQAQQVGALPGPGFFENGAPQPAADDAAALLHPSFRSYLEAKAAALGDRFTVRLHDRRIDQCGHAVALDRVYPNNDPVWQAVAAVPGADTMFDVQRARGDSDGPVAAPLRVGQVQQRADTRYGCASWIGLLALKDGIYQPRDAAYTAVAVTFTLDDSRSFDGQRDVDDMVVIGTVLETRPVMADGSVGDPLVVPAAVAAPEPAPVASTQPAPAAVPVAAAAPASDAAAPAEPSRAAAADWPDADALAPDLSQADLLDLRTGMAMDDADAALRSAHDGIIGVFETPAPPASAATDGPGPLDYRRVYLMRDGQEAVMLASYAPGGPVLAIMRRLVLDAGTLPYDRIEAALTAKYGEPATRIDGVGLMGWGPVGGQHCFALPLESYGATLAPVGGTGTEALNPRDFRVTQLTMGSLPAADREGLESCGAVLVYLAEQPETWGASGFSATLIDQTAMVQAAAALAGGPETVDIEIDF